MLLLEAAERPGGVMQSVSEEGYLFELGPQSFSETPLLTQLITDLGLATELTRAPDRVPRYVLIGNELRSVPLSPPALFASGLLSLRTKFALLSDAFGKSKPPATDESVAAFVRRKFTPELLNRLVAPFVSGIYAGDPEKLSFRAAFPKGYEAEREAGSILRGMKRAAARNNTGGTSGQTTRRGPTLSSFRSGANAVIQALAKSLGGNLRCRTAVRAIERAEPGAGFALTLASTEREETLRCEQLVLAVPAGSASTLLKGMAPQAATALARITYAPVAVVSLGYLADQTRNPLHGFGYLIPRASGLRTLGTVWNSSLFPGRAPDKHRLLTSFVGGATDPQAAALPPDNLASLVHAENSRILEITGNPKISRVTTYERAIPQYNLGHGELLTAAQAAISAVPGLHVIGNYWSGPAIGTCVEQAFGVARRLQTG